jgi:hypothetical protein
MRSIVLYSFAAVVLLFLSSPSSIHTNLNTIDYMTYNSFNFDDIYIHQNSQAINIATTNTARIKRAIRYQLNDVNLKESILNNSDLSIKFTLNQIDENNTYKLVVYVEDNINNDIMWNAETEFTIDNYILEDNLDERLYEITSELFTDFETSYPGFYTVSAR